MNESVRVPPHSNDAEQAFLGCLLLDKNVFNQIEASISAGDFFNNTHGLIFSEIEKLHSQNVSFDAITVSESFERQGTIESIGGLQYLASLVADVSSAYQAKNYAEIITDYARRRDLIAVSSQAINSAFDPDGKTTDEMIDAAEVDVLAIRSKSESGKDSLRLMSDSCAEFIMDLDKKYSSDDDFHGLPTGIAHLDHKLQGLEGGQLVIVAGRPGMGKTSFMLSLMESIEKVGTVAMFHLEMQPMQMQRRMMSRLSGVSMEVLKSPSTSNMSESDWDGLTLAGSKIKRMNVYEDFRPGLTVGQIRASARRLNRKKKLSAIMVDYLQIMKMVDGDNRNLQVNHITNELKNLAKELDCVVILLSQLNRNCEGRSDKRPLMSDLRESGGIEQDADIICLLYRDEIYNDDSNNEGIAEIIVAKNRDGETGTAFAMFDAKKAAYRSLDHLPSNYGKKAKSSNDDGLRQPYSGRYS